MKKVANMVSGESQRTGKRGPSNWFQAGVSKPISLRLFHHFWDKMPHRISYITY